jgi:hypothetical protein
MTKVTDPYIFLSDRRGNALESGHVYIGAAGQNPQSNPIQAYADEDFLIPLAQPIRTLAGYPVNGNSPTQVFVNADDYSMVVRDKRDTLVLSSLTSAPDVLTRSELSAILFEQSPAEAAVGAVPTSFEYYYGDCRRFGVSTAASAAANAAAFNVALSVGGRVYIDAPGTYVVNDNIYVPSNTHLYIGPGVTIQGAASKAWISTGIILIDGSGNVKVEIAGIIDGNKDNNPTGRAFGVEVRSSTDVTVCGSGSIINCPAQDATGINGGDGVYVGGAGSARVTVRDLLLDSNVRQGISITRCLDFSLINLRCHNQTGSDPGAGIDLEPDSPGVIKRGRVIGCYCEGNYRGMDIVDCEEITVQGLQIVNSRWNGMQIIRGTDIRVEAKIVVGNPTVSQLGTVLIEDSEDCVLDFEVVGSFDAQEANSCIRFSQGCRRIRLKAKVRNCKGNAIGIGGSGMGEDNTDIFIEGCHLYNCADPAQNAPVIFIDSNSGGTFFSRRVTIRNNYIYDDRTGGNEATVGIQVSGNVTSAVLADYRFGSKSNTIIGPTEKSTRAHWAIVNYDPPSLADGAGVTTTLTVDGAVIGDGVNGSFARDLQGISTTFYVSATDTVSMRMQNESGGVLDLASSAFQAELLKT